MTIRSLLFVSFSSFFLTSYAQTAPAIAWQKILGGSDYDALSSIQQTSDGGSVIAGTTWSDDGDVSGNHGDSDFWVVKLDSLGNLLWQKVFGGSFEDIAHSIDQTSDGGYIVAGHTWSNDGDVSGNHGASDFWVIKLDSLGDLLWQKALGGSSYDNAGSVQQTNDGGYIIAGITDSNDGDVSGQHGNSDLWVIKLDGLGNLLWQNALGGSYDEGADPIHQTNDGGYIVAGFTNSNDGDVSGNHGVSDFWVVKLDSLGGLLWQKALGGSDEDLAYSIEKTNDGGYVIAGPSSSNDGDVSGNHGYSDLWVIKLDGSGNLLWQRALGGSFEDVAHSIKQTNDDGYIVTGWASSNDGNVSGNHGSGDFWVVKLDGSGNLLWQRALGGSTTDEATSIEQTSDGGYLVAGWTWSNDDGDVGSGNHGSGDFWVVKLDSDISIGVEEYAGTSEQNGGLSVFPNPTSGTFQLSVEGRYIESISITEPLGREVLRKSPMTRSALIDLSAHSQGAYWATVQTVDGETFKKLVIKH